MYQVITDSCLARQGSKSISHESPYATATLTQNIHALMHALVDKYSVKILGIHHPGDYINMRILLSRTNARRPASVGGQIGTQAAVHRC